MFYKVKVSVNGELPKNAFRDEIENIGLIAYTDEINPFVLRIFAYTGMNAKLAKDAVLAIRRVAKRNKATISKFEAALI